MSKVASISRKLLMQVPVLSKHLLGLQFGYRVDQDFGSDENEQV